MATIEHLLREAPDSVSQPEHYTSDPSGIECIDIARHWNFCCGNALKYLWRAGRKGDAVEDLLKARQYIDFEITRLRGAARQGVSHHGSGGQAMDSASEPV